MEDNKVIEYTQEELDRENLEHCQGGVIEEVI